VPAGSVTGLQPPRQPGHAQLQGQVAISRVPISPEVCSTHALNKPRCRIFHCTDVAAAPFVTSVWRSSYDSEAPLSVKAGALLHGERKVEGANPG
jgi:hypothetical protein